MGFSQFMCILDLDSVTGVELVRSTSCIPKTYLVIYVSKKIGQGMEMDDYLKAHAKLVRAARTDEVTMMVQMAKDDQPRMLRDEIMRRAKIRNTDENSLEQIPRASPRAGQPSPRTGGQQTCESNMT